MKIDYDYGAQNIEFELIYKKRKTLSIEIKAPGNITVKAPQGVSKDIVLGLVRNKSKWIIQKLLQVKEAEERKITRQYVSGESFIYLGRNYSLQIDHDSDVQTPRARLYRGRLCVHTGTRDEKAIKSAVSDWYKAKAREKILERVQHYQRHFYLAPTKVIVKDQKRRWGSCTSTRELRFNWRCIMAPSAVIDYIVVHEMCHMVHMDHSKNFWGLVRKVLPDYEERKAMLRNNGISYEL